VRGWAESWISGWREREREREYIGALAWVSLDFVERSGLGGGWRGMPRQFAIMIAGRKTLRGALRAKFIGYRLSLLLLSWLATTFFVYISKRLEKSFGRALSLPLSPSHSASPKFASISIL
jgi:hypothetical protein